MSSPYISSVQVPVSSFEDLASMADELNCDRTQLVRLAISLAMKKEALPALIGIEYSGQKVPFPFRMSRDFVERLGGEAAARGAVKWAVSEGHKYIDLNIPS